MDLLIASMAVEYSSRDIAPVDADRRKWAMANKTTLSDPQYERIQHEVIALLESLRNTAIRQVNALMTAIF